MNYEDEPLGIPILPLIMGGIALGSAIYKGVAASSEASKASAYSAQVSAQAQKTAQLIPIAQAESRRTAEQMLKLQEAQNRQKSLYINIGAAAVVIATAAFLAFR